MGLVTYVKGKYMTLTAQRPEGEKWQYTFVGFFYNM